MGIAKALIALVGLVLLFPAVAAAGPTEEFLFQGGDEPFSGEPAVGMTMTGHDVNKPSRLTGFTIEPVDWVGNCEESTRGYPETLSLGANIPGTMTKRNDENDLYFSWSASYDKNHFFAQTWKLVGGQHRKHPHVWVGKLKETLKTWKVEEDIGWVYIGSCEIKGADADGFLHWRAGLIKACPKHCANPFPEIAFPSSAAAWIAHRSASPFASQSKKKKCKKGRKRNGKKRKCKHRKPRHPSPTPPAPTTPQAGWTSGRYTGHYTENAAIELRFNVVGSRLYTGAFDSFFVSANCPSGTPDSDVIAPVEATIASNGDFAGSGVYSPGFGLQIPWQIAGHITGKSITSGSVSVAPYMNTFGEQCSGTSHFGAEWFADYTL